MREEREQLLASIRKEFGEQSMFLLGQDERLNVKVRTSGSLLLDLALGGGVGKGKLVVIKGAEKVGKSSVLNLMIAEAQRLEPEKECGIIDLENAYDPVWAAKLGVDINRLFISQPDTYAEKVFDMIEYLLNTGKFSILGLDSVAGLVSREEMEQDDWDKESRVGGISKLLSKAMRKLINTGLLAKSETSLVFINQIRDKIGAYAMYGTPTEMIGGRSLRHAATQILEVAIGDYFTNGKGGDSKVVLGQQIKVKCVKNKIAAPHRQAKLDIYYESGMDRLGELISVAKVLNVLTGSAWLTLVNPLTGEVQNDLEGNPLRWHGAAKVREALDESVVNNGDLYLKVYEIVQNVLRGEE